MKMKTLQDLFFEQLRDIYDAERQLVKALPKMAAAATTPQLRQAFEKHLDQTEGQIERLRQVSEHLEFNLKRKSCAAMEGLIEEGKEVIDMKADDDVRDAGLIAAAQKVEHYEMASYGCLCSWAQQLGFTKALPLLQETLQEEKDTDQLLTQMAEGGINVAAQA